MLYTLSQADYPEAQLHQLLAQITAQDAVILWQNGVLQAVKNPDIFAKIPHIYVLDTDLHARGLTTTLPTITLTELVQLTVQFHPQLAY